ncbi:MAG: retropepsin-like aspartic protease [Nitrospirota bacterium]
MGLLGVLCSVYKEGHAIYRCYDKEGRHVLTDQPAQLERCIPLDVVTPPISDSKKLPVAPIPAVPGSTENRRALPEEQGASLANHTVDVPLQQVGHLFVVTVKLNGEQDARLIVDTGASHSIVSHRLAIELGLYSDSSMGTVTMNTVGGPVQAPLARIKSFRLAEAEVKDSVVVIYDLPDSPAGVEGLLGLNAMRQFQVTLDPTRKILSLQPTAK